MSIANGNLNYQMNRRILRAKARNISTDGLCPIGYNVRKWMMDAAVLPLRIQRSERGRERETQRERERGGARDKKDVCMHQYVYCVYIYIYHIYIRERERERERKREREGDFIQKIAYIWPDSDNLPRVAKDFDRQWTWHMQWHLRHPMVAPGSTCPYRVVLGALPTPSSMTWRAANDGVSAPGGRSAGASCKDWWAVAVPRKRCR